MWYARNFRFITDADVSPAKRFLDNLENPNEENYTDVVFVHSAEEAVGFPDNVLIAWPRELILREGITSAETFEDIISTGTMWEVAQVESHIDMQFSNGGITDFRDYGLPERRITLNDVVENWERVAELAFLRWGNPPTDFAQKR